jgi:hypothetical protein
LKGLPAAWVGVFLDVEAVSRELDAGFGLDVTEHPKAATQEHFKSGQQGSQQVLSMRFRQEVSQGPAGCT